MASLAHLNKRNEVLHIETETRLGQMRSSLLTAVQDQERAIKALDKAGNQRNDTYALALATYEDTLNKLLLRLDSLIKGGDFVATSQKILESLMFAEMPRRHNAIAEAYNKPLNGSSRRIALPSKHGSAPNLEFSGSTGRLEAESQR